MSKKQKTEFKNPCDGCILLVKCIPIYKNHFEDYHPYADKLIDHCSLYAEIYYKYEELYGWGSSFNPLDNWWNDNYGK